MSDHFDDGLEWWEMPESSLRHAEEQRKESKKKAAERRKEYNRRQRIYRQARKHKPHLMEQDGAHCQECGTTENLVVDHIIPLARGGSNEIDNLQLLCWHCNSSKAARR